MRWLTLVVIAAAATLILTFFIGFKNSAAYRGKYNTPITVTGIRSLSLARLASFAAMARSYIATIHFSRRYCFLIDMKMPSGAKRFFVYDLLGDSVIQSGLVTHGNGNGLSDTTVFSNEPGSNCSSLGRYRIGNCYHGVFGLAWKLYGLDKSNSNAFKRLVVLHSHPCVPESETAGRICRSWGCPTVSPGFLNQLKIYINRSNEPILLWIFK